MGCPVISPAGLMAFLRRYMQANLVLQGRPRALLDSAGTPIGRIESLTLAAGFVTVTGQCRGGEIALDLAEMSARAQIAGAQAGFRLTLPWPPDLSMRHARLQLTPAAAPSQALDLPHPFVPMLRQGLRLMRTLAQFLPDYWRWLRHGDLRARGRIKDVLGFGPCRPGGPLHADLHALLPAGTGQARPARPDPEPETEPETGPDTGPETGPDTGPDTGPATIVLPVFNALDLLRACLARLERTEGAWHLIVIEDCSTDPALRPWLRDWVARQPDGRVTLIEAPENRGFIASVNAAFAEILRRPAAQTGPVVLLNSDALVPPGWLSRLLAPLLADSRVASVTPFSNDAEIFSVPAICARQSLAPGQALRIDALAARLPAALRCHEAPTGVGFCMALSRAFLEQVPRFDPAFGRGYGEEVDWCRRTRARGGRHLGHAGLFVEHRGGASFGSEEKRRLIARNNAEITRRYPGYDRAVQDFILADPLRSARMALALAWAGSTVPAGQGVPVYLAHAMGGGAEHWLAARIATDAQAGQGAVVLRVGGPQRWQLEVHGAGGAVSGWSDDFEVIRALLALLPARAIFYSCGVGDSDPFSLPGHLLALHQGDQDRIEVLLHDYFPVSPAFTLLDRQGRYRGLPAGDDPDHCTRRPDGSLVTLADWQAEWGRLMARAARLRCFCPYSADLLARVWPDLADRIRMIPHTLIMPEAAALPAPRVAAAQPEGPEGSVHVAVLGNIAPHKGAALVQRLARMPARARGFEMMLLGNIDLAYPLPLGFRVHGDYRPEDIPRLLRHYRITHWLIPSVWPETFSFTTHEALATGLPVLAFDIGAQGDAVAAAANGHLLAYDPDADLAARILAALRRREISH